MRRTPIKGDVIRLSKDYHTLPVVYLPVRTVPSGVYLVLAVKTKTVLVYHNESGSCGKCLATELVVAPIPESRVGEMMEIRSSGIIIATDVESSFTPYTLCDPIVPRPEIDYITTKRQVWV